MSTVKGSKAGSVLRLDESCQSLVEETLESTADQLPCPRVTISELPDDVLLEIFGVYLDHQHGNEDAWHVLVHVCGRWRCLVFASPRHLHLRLLFMYQRSVKEALDVWPELPIAIRAFCYGLLPPRMQALVTNVIAALKQHDRVCEIHLAGYPIRMSKIFSAMKKPFPSLVNLMIIADVRNGSMIPDSFLGGSAPRLQSLEFHGVLCPAIEKLLLSTRNLVFLTLSRIPRSGRGYSSPEAMVNGLSVLTRLKSLRLKFHRDEETPRYQPQQASIHSAPFPRVVLSALTYIYFLGDNEYLEDIVSRIDTPLLANITIGFIDLSVSESVNPPLRDFIRRTEKFGACSQIDMDELRNRAKIKVFRRDGEGV